MQLGFLGLLRGLIGILLSRVGVLPGPLGMLPGLFDVMPDPFEVPSGLLFQPLSAAGVQLGLLFQRPGWRCPIPPHWPGELRSVSRAAVGRKHRAAIGRLATCLD